MLLRKLRIYKDGHMQCFEVESLKVSIEPLLASFMTSKAACKISKEMANKLWCLGGSVS